MPSPSDTPPSEAAQALAERTHDALWRDDFASQCLGMEKLAVGPGHARFAMTVRREMLNGFGICHGGYLTTFGDTAMAFASNSHDVMAVATNLAVDFIASAREGDRLVAEAQERARTRRTAVYDVTVTTAEGSLIAIMRGRVQRIPDRRVTGDA
ncbi:MAG: hydroxyphenylacetyl-CoA thioesterase PaaI [Gammaproteobacteria bacterium]